MIEQHELHDDTHRELRRLLTVGQWITEQIEWAERARDVEYCDLLLRVKNRVRHQMRASR